MSAAQASSSPLPSVQFISETSLSDRAPSDSDSRRRVFPKSDSCSPTPQLKQPSPDKTTEKATRRTQLATGPDPHIGGELDSKAWGRKLSEVPSDMLSVFRANAFGYCTHMSRAEDSGSVTGMDIDAQVVMDPTFPFLATGPQKMFTNNFPLVSPRGPLDDKDLIKMNDSGADQELLYPPDDASMCVDEPAAEPRDEDAPCPRVDVSPMEQDNPSRPTSSVRSSISIPIRPPAHYSTTVPSRSTAGQKRSLEDSGRIYPSQLPIVLARPTPIRPWYCNLPPEVSSTLPPGPRLYHRVSGNTPMSHSLIPIRPPPSDGYPHNVPPSHSLPTLSSASSLSSCRTTPPLVSPCSSLSSMSSVPSMPVSVSGSPYPCSQAEQYGLNVVSQPQGPMLQMVPFTIPRSMDLNGYSNARCDEPRAHHPMQAYAVPSWQSAYHPGPVHLPSHVSGVLPPFLVQHPYNPQDRSQSPANKKQRISKKRAKSMSGVEARQVYRCHICPRQFALPNGLAIHLKWHKDVPDDGMAQELELTTQPEVQAPVEEHSPGTLDLPAVRCDSREASVEEDVDPLMVMPPYLPRKRAAELVHSSHLNYPPPDRFSSVQYTDAPPDRDGLGLFLPPAALGTSRASTAHSFDVPLAALSIPDTRSSLCAQMDEQIPPPVLQGHDTSRPSQSASRSLAEDGDSNTSMEEATAETADVDPFSPYGGRRQRLAAQAQRIDVRDASPHGAAVASQRPSLVTPPRNRPQMVGAQVNLSPLRELVQLRPLPFGQADVYRS